MTAKERRARAQKNLATVAYLISPIDIPTLTKEVKLDTHYIDTVIDIAHQMNLDSGIKMTRPQVVIAIRDFYLTKIKNSNLYITGFRFAEGVDDDGRKIVEVFATIRVDLRPEPTHPPTLDDLKGANINDLEIAYRQMRGSFHF
jgi:hypothetical protein